MNNENRTIGMCPPETVLRCYLRGSLSPDEDAAITTHVEGCEKCEALLDKLSSEDNERIHKNPDPVEVSSTFLTGLGKRFGEHAAALQSRFSPGDCIGNYKIVGPLGHGAMGEVYMAKQISLNRSVAFKVIRTLYVNDHESVRRFEKSTKATGQLNHPHIVTAFDASTIDGVCYLAMELVDGLDVAELVNRVGPLKIADACEIVRQAAEGLAHGHSKGCVHRDVKPSNLLIDNEGRVKVTDFGLAMLMRDVWAPEDSAQDATAEGMILGTADYMAPEQFRNPRGVDGRADVYSLGCTLYKLLTGRAPFDSGKHRSTLDKILDHQQSVPPNLKAAGVEAPAALNALINEMLAKPVEQRCSSAEDVAKRLQPLCAAAALKELVKSAREAQADDFPNAATAASPPLAASVPGPQDSFGWNKVIATAFLCFALAAAITAGSSWWHASPGNGVFDIPGNDNQAKRPSPEKVAEGNPAFDVILDDTEAEFDKSAGSLGWRLSSLDAGYKGKHYYNEAGAKTARWTISGLPAGAYKVYATWPTDSLESCSDSVAYQLYDNNRHIETRHLNQKKAPQTVHSQNVSWALVDTVAVTAGRLVVEVDAVNSRGPGVCRVDAIRIVIVSD